MSSPAQAQFASGGVGIYRNSILWFSWGANGTDIPNAGRSITNTYAISGTTLAVTCSLFSIGGSGSDPDLESYRPGNWGGDALDDLYNIGGTGTSNTLITGLKNRTGGETASFTYACSATLGGVAYPLKGLVFADAEELQTNASGEWIQVITAAANVRVIDRFRTAGCTTSTTSVQRTGSTYRLTNTGTPPGCAVGPAVVLYTEGVTTGSVSFRGNGSTAISLGVMIHLGDFGDAPATYGVASHLIDYGLTGGTVPDNATTDTFNITRASLVQPTTAVLGTSVDVEAASLPTANALGDDANQSPDDENGVNVAALPTLSSALVGTTFSVPITCTGTAPIRGWIDFNRNGIFEASESSSNVPSCASGAATLNWTVPATITVGASYLRVRTAVAAAEIANPTGLARSGETEDHALTIQSPPSADLSITKTNNLPGTVDLASDTLTRGQATTYQLVVTNSGPEVVTGAVVRDPAVTGLTCTTLDCTGAACPSPNPAVATLRTGLTLGALAVGAANAVTLNLGCTVN